MTIQKFRKLDLLVLTILAVISDLLIAIFGILNISLFLSIAFPILILVFVRWHPFGFITQGIIMLSHLLIFGLFSDNGWLVALLHSASILGFTLSYTVINKYGKKTSIGFQHIFTAFMLGYIGFILLSWGLYHLINPIRLDAILISHSINMLLGLGLLLLINRQKVLLVNMVSYLLEKNEEK